MAASVTNTVSTVFTVNDKASAAILRIANAANSASGAVGRLQQAMQRVNSTRMNAIAPDLRAAVSAAAALSGHMRAMASYAGAIGRMRVSGRLPSTPTATGGGGGGGAGGMSIGLGTAASAYYLTRNIAGSAKNATESLLELQAKYEDMRHTFAGQIQALGMAKSFKDADIQAELLMVRLRQMAAKLPGDMNYYAQMVQEASTSLFRAGVPDMESILGFMGEYGAAVYSIAARHKDLGIGARELFSMVGGVARRQMPLFNYLSQYMDKSVQAVERFNQLNPAQRFEQLKKALSGFKDATASAGELVSAKMGEFRDRVSEIVRLGTTPMFEKMKHALDALNKYLEKNHQRLEDMVAVVSDKLFVAFSAVGKTIGFLAENMDTVLSAAQGFLAIWVGTRLISGIGAVTAAMATLGTTTKAAFGPLATIAYLLGAGGGLLSAKIAGAFRTPEEIAKNPLYRGMLSLTPGGTEAADRLLRQREYSKQIEAVTVPLLGNVSATEEAFQRMYSEQFSVNKEYADFIKMAAEKHGYDVAAFGKVSKDLTVAPEDRSKVNYDFRFSRFDIRQNFAEGFDPDRIAVAFATDLARLSEMKLHSSMSPVTGGLSQGGF